MDEKDEIPLKLLCMSCLCVGRKLRVITNEKLKRFYLDTINEIPLNNVPVKNPYLCWECESIIKKVVAFKQQVQDSYRILLTYPRENLPECLLTDVARPPRLRQRALSPVSYIPSKVRKISDESDGGYKNVKIERGERDSSPSDDTDDSLPSDFDDFVDVDFESMVSKVKEKKKKKSNVTSKVRKTLKAKRSQNGKKNVERRPLSHAIPKSENSSDSSPRNDDTEMSDFGTFSTLERTGIVKEELKIEFERDTSAIKNETSYLSDSLQSDSNADLALDEEIEQLIADSKNKSKIVSQIKKPKKTVKRLQKSKPTKFDKNAEHPKVTTVEMSYEEMLFERERELERESYVKALHKCETCIIGFNYKNSYKAHVTAKHSPAKGDYICPICKTMISSVQALTAHYKRHLRRYECSICQTRTLDMKVMQQHYFTTHEISLKQYKCQVCGKISNNIDDHRQHKETHRTRIECDECDKTFMHRVALMNHKHTVHEENNKFPCTKCDKVFRWKLTLKRHLDRHDVKDEPSTAAYCATCSVTFSSVCAYQKHMKNSLRHITPEQLKLECDHCNRRFADKTKLRDHIEEKHLHKTYHCHICMKPFKNRVGADQHVRNVHNRKINVKICHHCGKGFPDKRALNQHEVIHSCERPLSCDICQRTFKQKSALYTHRKRVHKIYPAKRSMEYVEPTPQ